MFREKKADSGGGGRILDVNITYSTVFSDVSKENNVQTMYSVHVEIVCLINTFAIF